MAEIFNMCLQPSYQNMTTAFPVDACVHSSHSVFFLVQPFACPPNSYCMLITAKGDLNKKKKTLENIGSHVITV